jgi:hypothetical protein
MSKWDKYSNPKPGYIPATTRTPYDPDSCPPQLDPKLWSLALLFEQLAIKDGIQLPQGRFLIHDYLFKRINDYRDKPPGYWRDSKGVVQTPDVCVGAAIREFWTYWRDEHALDLFCSPVTFDEMLQTVRERAKNKRLVARAKASRDSASG